MFSGEAVITQVRPYKALHFAESNGLLVSSINLETWYLFLKSDYSRVWGQIPSSLVCELGWFIHFSMRKSWGRDRTAWVSTWSVYRKMCQARGWDLGPGVMLRFGECPCPWLSSGSCSHWLVHSLSLGWDQFFPQAFFLIFQQDLSSLANSNTHGWHCCLMIFNKWLAACNTVLPSCDYLP